MGTRGAPRPIPAPKGRHHPVPVPEVEKAIRADRGDVVIIRTERHLNDAAIESLKGQLKGAFPDNKVLVLTGGLDAGLMKREHLRALRDSIDAVLSRPAVKK